ncbi:MAG: adenylyltransferase/cytidyltransferase family protein [Patescibacteria group bacterium]|nr:adenylyltransferase/cytidyltransferase family protein [Patescibacteria group bacterium]
MTKGKIGFTSGTFDLLHSGHVQMLKECKLVCDYLIVGLQVDASKEREKNKPILSLSSRNILLSSIRYVDEVICYQTEKELIELMKLTNPDIRIIGEDWKDKPFTGHELDIQIMYNSRKHDISTTMIRREVYLQEKNKSS